MLLVLWSCGYDRRRASSGRAWGVSLLDRWRVGSLDRWRVGGKKGRRDRGSSILSSTILEVREDVRMRGCKDARIQTLRACKVWVSDRLVYRNHWDRIPQTAYSHGSLRP